MKRILACVVATTVVAATAFAADPPKEPIKAAVTNAPPAPYLLPTNRPSFFRADKRTGATYMKFAPDGTYEVIMSEHMGVLPSDAGKWSQATNGMVTLLSTAKHPGHEPQQKVMPTTYRERTFLYWPDVSYKRRLQQACEALDRGSTPTYYEFLISEGDFSKGTGRPYPFKYHKEMNRITGAQD